MHLKQNAERLSQIEASQSDDDIPRCPFCGEPIDDSSWGDHGEYTGSR